MALSNLSLNGSQPSYQTMLTRGMEHVTGKATTSVPGSSSLVIAVCVIASILVIGCLAVSIILYRRSRRSGQCNPPNGLGTAVNPFHKQPNSMAKGTMVGFNSDDIEKYNEQLAKDEDASSLPPQMWTSRQKRTKLSKSAGRCASANIAKKSSLTTPNAQRSKSKGIVAVAPSRSKSGQSKGKGR